MYVSPERHEFSLTLCLTPWLRDLTGNLGLAAQIAIKAIGVTEARSGDLVTRSSYPSPWCERGCFGKFMTRS